VPESCQISLNKLEFGNSENFDEEKLQLWFENGTWQILGFGKLEVSEMDTNRQ